MASDDGVTPVQKESPDPRPLRSSLKTGSIDKKRDSYEIRKIQSSRDDVESIVFEDDAQSIRPGDFKEKQKFKGWVLLWLAYQSTGVIYGDIGTSPLYVYSSTFTSEPARDDLLGALSLIIWSLTLIVTIKYVAIVLCANDEGEGGTFAIYNLLSRYCNIAKRDPKTEKIVKLERYRSTELKPSTLGVRDFLEKSKAMHVLLKGLSVFGVSLILADSILTPAQSVLGAIQGLKVVRPEIENGTIVGISCGILVFLFLLQPVGVSRLGTVFAPIVMLWLLFNCSFGIYNLIQHDHTVLKAFSPYYAGLFFVRNKKDGWIALGGILLSFTGVEALFADIGAFSKGAIQISWLCFTYPCLLLAYIGQAAHISRDPSAYSNPFFNTVPPGMFYPSLVLSILAAIVASQAMITSTFQLLSQVMNTSYFPQIKMLYTSERFHGQVYIPAANWLIMVGTVIVTAVYNNTTKLGHAYGVCVILVTFITTCLVALVALVVWRLNWVLVLAVWLPFITLDGLFLSSSMTKVPDGAWFTLLLAVLLSSIFILWRYGKETQWAAERRGRVPLRDFVYRTDDGQLRLKHAVAGEGQLSTIKGMGIFFDKAGDMVPTVYEEFLRKFEAQPEVCVFLHLKALAKPHVPEGDKYTIMRTSLPHCYRLIIRHGYKDRVVTTNLGDIAFQYVRGAILSSQATWRAPAAVAVAVEQPPERVDERGGEGGGGSRSVGRALAALDSSRGHSTVYIVGHPSLRLAGARQRRELAKRLVLGVFVWMRENTRARIAQWDVPVDKLVEVGFVRDL